MVTAASEAALGLFCCAPPVSACSSAHAMYLNVFGWFGSRSYTQIAHQHASAADICCAPPSQLLRSASGTMHPPSEHQQHVKHIWRPSGRSAPGTRAG